MYRQCLCLNRRPHLLYHIVEVLHLEVLLDVWIVERARLQSRFAEEDLGLLYPYLVCGACHKGHDPPEQATGPEKSRPKAISFISTLKHGVRASPFFFFFFFLLLLLSLSFSPLIPMVSSGWCYNWLS
jgi:hypothetical protein